VKQIVILNEAGFVGEELIRQDYSVDFSNLSGLEDYLFENKTISVFFRPSYDALNNQFLKLKNNQFITILTPDQTKEKLLLESYFKLTLLDDLSLQSTLKDLLKIDFDAKELMDFARRRPGYKSLMCVLHCGAKLNFSYLINTFRGDKTIRVYTKEDFKNLDSDFKYSNKYLEECGVDPIFYELLFSELFDEETVPIKVFKKILDKNFSFDKEELSEIEKLKHKFWIATLSESNIERPTFGYPIKDLVELKEEGFNIK